MWRATLLIHFWRGKRTQTRYRKKINKNFYTSHGGVFKNIFYAVCVRLYRPTHTQIRSEGSPERAPGTRTHLSGRAQPRSPRSQAPPARGSSGVRRGRALRAPSTPKEPGARGEKPKPQPRSPAPSALPAAIFPAALCRRGAGISRRFAARRPTAAPPA